MKKGIIGIVLVGFAAGLWITGCGAGSSKPVETNASEVNVNETTTEAHTDEAATSESVTA